MTLDTPSFLDCVLITGASSGIGKEFAKQLAPLSLHLILVARRDERLKEVQSALTSQHPQLQITVYTCDLTFEDEREQLFNNLSTSGIRPTLLINNAGLGDYGEFTESRWNKIKDMIEVNMTALTHLCYLFLPGMKDLRNGAIINVSSIASLVPISDFAVYAATKAYVTSFSEALRSELRGDGIPVLTVCPGPVHTEFGEVAAREGKKYEHKGFEQLYVSQEEVVLDALTALLEDKPRVYPGWKVALFATTLTILPFFLVRSFNAKRTRKIPSDD